MIFPLMNESQYTKLRIVKNLSPRTRCLTRRDDLQQFFPPSSLPSEYGGTCHCATENILFKEDNEDEVPQMGGIVHVRNGVLSKVSVGVRSEGQVEQRVEEGDLVDLSFSSLGSDLEYSAYLVSEKGRVGVALRGDA